MIAEKRMEKLSGEVEVHKDARLPTLEDFRTAMVVTEMAGYAVVRPAVVGSAIPSRS